VVKGRHCLFFKTRYEEHIKSPNYSARMILRRIRGKYNTENTRASPHRVVSMDPPLLHPRSNPKSHAFEQGARVAGLRERLGGDVFALELQTACRVGLSGSTELVLPLFCCPEV